jgi:protein disulfide-isomerase
MSGLSVRKNCINLVKLCIFIFCLTLLHSLYSEDTLWLTDFELAKEKSGKEHLPILVNFTGSDWCPYCKKLENEVFSKPKFATYVKENFILLKIDFPQAHPLPEEILNIHKELAEKYKVKEFPAVVFLNEDGEFILKSGYREGGIDSYISFLKIVKKIAFSL